MFSFASYYDLKDESNLPPNATFVDPYDGFSYAVQPKETLSQFMSRILERRRSQGYPEMFPAEFKAIVVISLSNQADKKILDTYFIQKSVTPTVSEMISLASTTVSQLKQRSHVSYLTRQVRADKCNGCALHNNKKLIKPSITSLATKLVGLNEVVQSEKEKGLGVCGVCGCGLQAKVKYETMAVLAGLTPEQLAKIVRVYGDNAFEKCWILNEAVNNPAVEQALAKKLAIAGSEYVAKMHEYKAKNGR